MTQHWLYGLCWGTKGKGRFQGLPRTEKQSQDIVCNWMSLQTGRVSFLSTELIAAPDSGDSLEHAEPVSQPPPAAVGERGVLTLRAGYSTGQLGRLHPGKKHQRQLQRPPRTVKPLPT